MFVHYPCSDRFTTFEAGAGIEICALTAGVEVSVALGARAVDVNVRWGLFSARAALRRLAKRHHAWRAWAFTILRL